jgi:PAS domain S-box-containing protein
MLNLKNISIGRKQMLIIMLTSTITLLLACVAFVGADALRFREDLSNKIATMAQIAGNNCAAALDFNDPKAAAATLEALRAKRPIAKACVYSRQGEVFAVYQRDGKSTIAGFPPIQPPGREFRDNQLRIFLPITMQDEKVGTIYVTCDLYEFNDRLKRAAVVAMLVLGISLLAAFFLSMRLQRVISGPVLQLAQAVRTVALEKTYSVRAKKESNDELGQLVDGFNEMLVQIQARDAALQTAREDLEARVVERTTELASTNQALQAEIAGRQQTERALRQSEERFRIAAETANDVIFEWDLKQGLEWEGKIDEMLGYEPGEFPRTLNGWAAAVHPEDLERTMNAIQALLEGRAPYAIEYRVRRKDGIYRWWSARGALARTPDGKPARMIGSITDITKRKQAEAARDRLAMIIESTTDLVGVSDTAGNHLYLNRAGRKLLGVGLDEDITKTNSADFVPNPASHRSVTEGIPTAARLGIWSGEIVLLSRSGQEFPVSQVILAHKTANGEVESFSTIMRDITARKATEAELESIHKQLVDVSRRGGMAEIATNVLHNVGNVLNSVNVSTGLLVESVKKSKVSSLARVVVLLQEHAHDLAAFLTNDDRGKHVTAHLAQLSEQLMADQTALVGELDSLRRNVDHIKEIVAMQQNYATFGGVKEMINVVNLVEDSLRINEGALSRHRVELIREFETVPLMNVEKHKILQILVNLVRNAKYACDESGHAHNRLTVRVASGNDRVKVSVTDNGIGIPPENLTRIFNHGFTTRKGGHGFGLHSGALAAKEMGGSLNVQSDGPGKGSVFTLELPIEQESSAKLNAI